MKEQRYKLYAADSRRWRFWRAWVGFETEVSVVAEKAADRYSASKVVGPDFELYAYRGRGQYVVRQGRG